MPFGELAGGDVGEHEVGQRQDTQFVAHGAAVPADARGQLFLGHVVLVHQRFEGVGGLEGRQVFALKVLHQGDFAEGPGVAFHDFYGRFGQAGFLAGVPAALAGDDDVFAAFVLRWGDDDGLEQAVDFDGLGQLFQRFFVEKLARLAGVGLDVAQAEAPRRAFDRRLGQHGAEAPSFFDYSHSFFTSSARSW